MKDNRLLVLTLLVGLFLIVSSIVVFGGSISAGGGSITQPINNSYYVIAGTYTFKGSLSGLNSTDNVTWYAVPNGTTSATFIRIGSNTTANGTDFTNNTAGITAGHGNFSIIAAFNETSGSSTNKNFTNNVTHFRVIIDNEAPVFATVFFNYSSTNGSASNTGGWVNATNTNRVIFNNTGTIQLLVQINNADLSNQTYLHELANTSLFYVFNSSSVGTSSAGMAKIPQSSGPSGFTMNNTFVGPGSDTLGNFTVNYTTVIDVSNFSEGNYSLVLYVADNSSSDTNDSVYSKFYYNVFEIIVVKTPTITGGSITQPANNSHFVIAGTYTFKGALSGLNATDNVTWFALPNGTESANATLIGINTTANGTHFTRNTNIITTGHGRFSITASFNWTRTGGTPVNNTFNVTHFNVTVDNEAPVFATVFFNYSSTNGSASNTPWVNATNTNGVVFNNTGTIQLLVQINNADLSNQTYLHELANTSLFYVFNSSSVGTSSAGMAKLPESRGVGGFTASAGPGSSTLGNFSVNYTTVIDVSNFSEGNYSLVLYVADNSSSDVNDSVYSKFYYNVFEITVDKTPSITIEKVTTATTIDVSGSIKYKCTVNDDFYGGFTNTIKLTKPSGATVSESFGSGTEHEFSVDDVNEAGEYTVKCTTTETAYGKLSASASGTFEAHHAAGASGGGTSGGGGGGGSSSGTISGGIFVNLDLTTGDGSGSLSGSQGTTKSFSFDGETKHTIEFTTVGTDLVTLTIFSDPVKVQLNIGDTKDVDVDSDGVNDLKVTLNSITDGKADVTLLKSTAAVAVEEAAEEEVTPIAAAEEEEEAVTGEAKSSKGLVITIIVIIAVIILAALLLRKKK